MPRGEGNVPFRTRRAHLVAVECRCPEHAPLVGARPEHGRNSDGRRNAGGRGASRNRRPQDDDPGGGGESLLVVDDDPFIARLLEIELKAAGYDVRVASDGEQALRPLRSARRSSSSRT